MESRPSPWLLGCAHRAHHGPVAHQCAAGSLQIACKTLHSCKLRCHIFWSCAFLFEQEHVRVQCRARASLHSGKYGLCRSGSGGSRCERNTPRARAGVAELTFPRAHQQHLRQSSCHLYKLDTDGPSPLLVYIMTGDFNKALNGRQVAYLRWKRRSPTRTFPGPRQGEPSLGPWCDWRVAQFLWLLESLLAPTRTGRSASSGASKSSRNPSDFGQLTVLAITNNGSTYATKRGIISGPDYAPGGDARRRPRSSRLEDSRTSRRTSA